MSTATASSADIVQSLFPRKSSCLSLPAVMSSYEEEEVEEEKKKKKPPKQAKKQQKDGGKGGPDKKRQAAERAESVLPPADIGRMVDLGLGRGINATNPSPWLNKSAFQVREVTLHNILGTEEGGVVQSYAHEVSSVQSMQTKMSASVPISQQVSVGVDAELSRSYSTSRRSVGKKILTRSIAYRADFDDLIQHTSVSEETPAGVDAKPRVGRKLSSIAAVGGKAATGKPGIARALSSAADSPHPVLTFEQRLAKWILERLLEEGEIQELDTYSDPVEILATFVAEWPRIPKDVKQLVGKQCREFVNHFGITHYVSTIELGAATYKTMSEEDYQLQLSTKGSLGIEKMASVDVQQKAGFSLRSKSKEGMKIGRMDKGTVQRGTVEEAVVGVKFQPINSLLKTKLLREKLKGAIKSYIDNQEHSKSNMHSSACSTVDPVTCPSCSVLIRAVS